MKPVIPSTETTIDGGGRRRVLSLIMLGAAAALVGGAMFRLRGWNGALDPAIAARLKVLRPQMYILVRDLARRIVASDEPGVPSPDDVGVAEFADAYLFDLPLSLRHDFLRLLLVIEQFLPLGSGFARRFTELGPAEQDRVLAEMESSHLEDLRAGFAAIKGVVMMGYYRDPSTFSILGYPGPLIGRPEAPPQ
jgi:hypothetical protein